VEPADSGSNHVAGAVVQQRATPPHDPLSCNTVPSFRTYAAVTGHKAIAFTQRVVLRCFRGRSSEAEHQLPKLADTHSYAQYLDVIDRLGLGPAAREQGFRRLVFNVAGANRDDHTKNLSFCCEEDGTWSLSPAYDVNHAFNPQGQWTQRHQMSVNGKFEDITRADLLELADRYVVPAPAQAIDDVFEAVSRWPSFAEQAGVEEFDVVRIAADLVAFRPS
jgi:HipA-like C-terminal domain